MASQPDEQIRLDVEGGCERKRLEEFLAGRLTGEAQDELLTHLDSCAACCEHLQTLAASEAEWGELPELFRRSIQFKLSSSELNEAGNAGTESEVSLDFLAPSDDPAMLGRIGHYEVMGVIGQGGMGIVLKSYDRPLNRTVAIKVLAPQLAVNGVARQRFAREAQAAAAVVHQHVIAIHGVAEHGGLPYLVMPYLPGQSLQQRIDQNGPLAVAEILRVGMQAASGLAAAHAQGLVHRDVKPANILLEKGIERVVITDFGLARAADDASLTRSGVIAGTPHYMAPEQARGDAIDHRADLFSLGASMYAMCTGMPPFRAMTALGVLRRVTEQEPHSIRDINTEIPEWMCEIVEKLLAKRVEDRFQSASEVADLFARHLAHLQHPATNPMPPRLRELVRDKRRSRRMTLAVSTVLFVGLVVGSLVLLRPEQSKRAAFVPEPTTAKKSPTSTSREFRSAEEQRRYWEYWMNQCGRHAADWTIFPRQPSVGEEGGLPSEPLRRLPQPVFGHVERPSQFKYQDQIGGVYLWVDAEDAPAVIGTVLANSEPSERRLSHVFASLSANPLTASWRGQELWTPESGIAWESVAEMSTPEKSVESWNVQVRAIAGRFGGFSIDKKQRRWELTIVPESMYRWEKEESETIQKGAVFAICEERDPEIILLIESWQNNSEYGWKYALAPFSNRELHATLDGKEVWQVGPRPSPVPETSPRWAISGIEYLPEPEDLGGDVD